MQLTPREKDKLLLFTAALLAERRLVKACNASMVSPFSFAALFRLARARGGVNRGLPVPPAQTPRPATHTT